MISARALTRTEGRTAAVIDVTLDVASGECIAIAGSDAGGRTTLLRLLATLIRPTSGSLQIGGLDATTDVFNVRSRIVYVAPEWIVAARMRVDEYLYWLARARGHAAGPDLNTRVRHAVVRAGLAADHAVASLAPQARPALAMAAALLVRPAVLLLDDPFGAIAATARPRFAEWLAEARAAGAALVIAAGEVTHVESFCSQVLRLESGRLVQRDRDSIV